MKLPFITTILATALCIDASMISARSLNLHTNSDKVLTLFDGGKEQIRSVMQGGVPEIIETTASEVTLISDIDTLRVCLDDWESAKVCVVTEKGDSVTFLKIHRNALNPFENLSPEMRAIPPSGKLSREQAAFDIDALIDAISNIHPNMFSDCSQVRFFQSVRDLKCSLPDSLSASQLYLGLSPIVAMLADGHTHLLLPESEVFCDDEAFMPLYARVTSEKKLQAIWSAEDAVPANSEILTVNGISADSIISSMMSLQSGERDHLKLVRVNNDFTGLYHLMYPANRYSVTYRQPGYDKTQYATLLPVPWAEIKSYFASVDDDVEAEPYSYITDKSRNMAILNFRACQNPTRMEQFADSMFRDLREHHIGNLIIDVRENGGGNSQVGDVLLRYICPQPFTQMDKVVMRITPLTGRLVNARNATPGFNLYEISEADYQQPHSLADGLYDGNVYLLTSNKTFSAGASFAWVFAQCKLGPVIGEETGGMNVCYGDKVWYTMPISGLECGISFKRFWQFRADESSIHGALPTISTTAAEALSTAISIINGSKEN